MTLYSHTYPATWTHGWHYKVTSNQQLEDIDDTIRSYLTSNLEILMTLQGHIWSETWRHWWHCKVTPTQQLGGINYTTKLHLPSNLEMSMTQGHTYPSTRRHQWHYKVTPTQKIGGIDDSIMCRCSIHPIAIALWPGSGVARVCNTIDDRRISIDITQCIRGFRAVVCFLCCSTGTNSGHRILGKLLFH